MWWRATWGQSSTEVGLRVKGGWEHDLLVSACEASGRSVCEVMGSFGQSSTGHVHVSHSKAVRHPLTMYLVGCYIVYTLCGDNSLRQHTMLFFRILPVNLVLW